MCVCVLVMDLSPSLDEIYAARYSLKTGKAAGPDGVLAELLKSSGPAFIRVPCSDTYPAGKNLQFPRAGKTLTSFMSTKERKTKSCVKIVE